MKAFTVLFLCTGNSARSILAEALLNQLGSGRFRAFSAGSRPAGRVSPFTLSLLGQKGIPAANLRSKSWDEFAGTTFDLVVTVCDDAAREVCPIFPGTPLTVHWGLPDPARVSGSDSEKAAAFEKTFETLSRRIGSLAALPVERLSKETLKQKLGHIGKVD